MMEKDKIYHELAELISNIKAELRTKKPNLISIDRWIWKINRRIEMLRRDKKIDGIEQAI